MRDRNTSEKGSLHGVGKGKGILVGNSQGAERQQKGGYRQEKKYPGPGVQTQAIVLLVEDDSTVLKVTTQILQRAGFQVLEAASPEIAISISDKYQGNIDLLITDVVMPGLYGVQLAEGLRMKRPDMRVLYYSGYPMDMIARLFANAPVFRIVQKPFTINEFIQAVRQALEA